MVVSTAAFLVACFLIVKAAAQPAGAPLPAQFAQTSPASPKPPDWASLSRYRDENARLAAEPVPPGRVVFLGDSITDSWGRRADAAPFFPGRPYVNRGISGQTTPQMLVRFEQDVIHLKPAAVLILAGTNDVAGNTGPETPEVIEDNFRAMTTIARANGLRVVLASILPVARYPWRPAVEPVAEVLELNKWLKSFCAENHLTYLDYYTALDDGHGGMRQGSSIDGVHPTAAGYAIMAPLAEAAIRRTLAHSSARATD